MSFYDAIYKSDECPEDYVINDNRLIDKWVENKFEEAESARKKALSKRKGVSHRSAYQHESVTVYGDD